MNFPWPTVEIGECIAMAREDGTDPRTRRSRPSLTVGGRSWVAARLAYHLNCEPIPCRPASRKEGLVLHTCDVQWCINPKHLYLGTAKQNTKDIDDRNPAWRDKQAATKRGKQPRFGILHSPESKLRMREARLAWYAKNPRKEETTQKRRAALLAHNAKLRAEHGSVPGRKPSEETRRKMSEAQRAQHARRRAEKAAQAAQGATA